MWIQLKKPKDIHITSVEFDPEMKLALFVSKDIFCFHFVINAIILNANFGYWFIVYDSNPYNVFKSIYCF